MADCRNCGAKLPTFTFGELSDLCRGCRRIREEQRKRFAATNEYDFFTETLGPHAATYGLIAANVIVFVAMVKAGVSPIDPTTQDLISHGADYGPKTLGEHQYWRLITNAFVHIGLLHIALNMWCLFSLGKKLEDFFGRLTTLACYVLTAAGASVLSLSWSPYRVSAGASGAVFGITGVLISFLYFGKHDLTGNERRYQLGRVGRFALINLLLGLQANTDNMAHLGGLVAGLGIGYLLSLRKREDQKRIPLAQLAGAAVLIIALTATVGHAKQPQMEFIVAQEAYARDDFKAAIAPLKVYVKKYPADANAHGLLAYCYDREKQNDLAEQEYETALKLDPNLAYAHENLAILYVAKKRFTDSIPHFEFAMKEGEDFGSYNLYASALAELGRQTEAESVLRKAIDSESDDGDTHRKLALVLKGEGKLTEAAAELEKAATLEKELAKDTSSPNAK